MMAIVCTTINLPAFMESYVASFKESELRPEDVCFIIVADNKTPERLSEQYLSRITEPKVEFWTVSRQYEWLRNHYPDMGSKIEQVIPENSPRRRNFGYLRALELNAERTVVIDDDNYPLLGGLPIDNWFLGHMSPASWVSWSVESQNRYINPCYIYQPHVYARGYPFDQFFKDSFMVTPVKDVFSVVNTGLWVGKPDVDAIFNLMYPEMRNRRGVKAYQVARGHYIPINTQNTSFTRRVAPVFHNVLQTKEFDRFDDIWNGLFIQAIAHHLGDHITFGLPMVQHLRNVHDYAADLRVEHSGMVTNIAMWRTISNIELTAKNYPDAYLEIANVLQGELADSMRLWVTLTDRLR